MSKKRKFLADVWTFLVIVSAFVIFVWIMGECSGGVFVTPTPTATATAVTATAVPSTNTATAVPTATETATARPSATATATATATVRVWKTTEIYVPQATNTPTITPTDGVGWCCSDIDNDGVQECREADPPCVRQNR